jgi:acetoin utilization deacetylase AcuC-like enzyme
VTGEDRPPGRAPLHVWSSDRFEIPLPESHPFPIAKYRALRERLIAEAVVDALHVHPTELAPLEWLPLAHDRDYARRATEGALSAAEVRRMGLPWSPELVRRARGTLFGTVQAAFAALEHGVAGNLGGGTHHAYRDRGEAYCLFNDVAIAIAVLREQGRARRPFVLDLDVHQGNGTAAIFAEDPSVFTFSIHGAGNYPLHKERGSFDLELPDGTADDAYLAALDRHAPDALDRHRPDLVFYQSGVDALAEDRLGRLALTHAGLSARDARVFAWCRTRALPVVVLLGGGYGRPLEATIEAHVNVWRAARAALDRAATR